jgi:aspartyl-tRNA(Asn)/glutamyl-tRNA(Gln) amidotransferase subunit C
MPISREQVDYVARLARLELSDQEKHRFAEQLDAILQYVEKLGELDTSGVEPLVHAAERENVFRDDARADSLARRDVLSNAPDSIEGCFRVPRIIE